MSNSRKNTLDKEYILLRKKGWRYVRKGLVFLAVCLVIGQVAQTLELPFAGLISESTIIAGWVALWRPMEIFLYELPELKEQGKGK